MANATLKRKVKESLHELCRRAAAGSQWAALLVCIESEPRDLQELLRVVGVTVATGKYATVGFNACADAYEVYLDAVDSGIGFA